MNKIARNIRAAFGRPLPGKADFSEPATRAALTYGYKVYNLSPANFVKSIAKGCPFCHVFETPEGTFHRKKGFFKSADFIGIDIDNDQDQPLWTIEQAAADSFIANNALFIYSTPSHTEARPRFRIIFVLPHRITDPDQYEKLAKALTRAYPQADQSTWNQTRFFYGAGPNGILKKIAKQTLNPHFVETTLAIPATEYTPRAEGKAQAPTRRDNRGFSDKQQQVLDRLFDEAVNAPKGQRSERDFSLVNFACKLGLSKSEIWAMVKDFGKFAERGEVYFDNTFAAAYERAQVEINQSSQYKHPTTTAKPEKRQPAQAAFDTESVIARAMLDERGLAQLMADEIFERAIYNVTSKHWRRFQDGCWQDDFKEHAVLEAADRVIERLRAAQRDIWDNAPADQGNPGKTSKAATQAKAVGKALRKLNTATGISNVERIARRLNPIEETEFDLHPQLLNVQNGTIDLDTGDFRKAKAGDYITRQAAVKYDPKATAPRFSAFLDAAFEGNWPVVDYFMEFMGLALTGYSPDEFVLAYGLGGNGKTVLFNILSLIMGSYASTVRMEIFLKGRFGGGNKDEYYITRLHRARFVKAVELAAGTLHESLIKELTGGGSEHLTARHPGGRPFDFQPTHSLAIIGNHRPRIRSADQGIRRRPKLIEFRHDFTKSGRRPQQVVEAELMAEAPGILNILIEGYNRYRDRGGFDHPADVIAASADFVEQDDSVKDFLEKALVVGDDKKIATADVYRKYVAFCEENQFENDFKGQRGLNRAFRERGLKLKRVAGGTYLMGYAEPTAWEAQNEGF